MSEVDLKRLKQVDIRTELLVNGYVRVIIDTLGGHTLFENVPNYIHSLCMLFYFVYEYFDIIGKGVSVSDDRSRITRNSDVDPSNRYLNTSFGKTKILSMESKIYRWEIKIHKGSRFVTIGISSNYDHRDKHFVKTISSVSDKHIYYAYNGYGGIKADVDEGIVVYSKAAGHVRDIIELELDLIEKKITFYKNGISQGVAFTDIKVGDDIVYRLSVSLGGKDNKVSIINFVEDSK